MRNRPTTEIIMIIMIVMIASVVALGAIGVLIIEVVHPERDTDGVLGMLYDIVKVALGAVIGYGAGRVTHSEAGVWTPLENRSPNVVSDAQPQTKP